MISILVASIVIGLGATLAIDLWSLLLRRAFGISSLDFCLLGRWFLHMPAGRLVHANIATAEPRRGECIMGWLAHYSIGVSLSLAFLLLAGASWLQRPSLLPAIAFGVVTTLIPFLVLQPSLGLGVASSKAPNPTRARMKSLMTHTVFGLGLYLMGLAASPWLFR